MDSLAADFPQRLDALFAAPTFGMEPGRRRAELLALLKAALADAAGRDDRLRRYFDAWPVPVRDAGAIAELPYLPVGVFKADPPLALVAPQSLVRTLASSATTGQTPSRVVLDALTSKRMTRGVTLILRDFVGPERRPYLVVDTPQNASGQAQMGARTAAIQGLRAFATQTVCCLHGGEAGDPQLDVDGLLEAARRWRGTEVLVYGFTFVLWRHFVLPLQSRGIRLDMPKVRVLHSGGWKRLQEEAVTREAFARGVASVFGCDENRVVDFYGMVENVGVVYPDCEQGNKHVPAFAEVIVRDPLTLAPVAPGGQGLVQVCSVLPASFPGYLLLTEDLGEVVCDDGCTCGRRGIGFRFVKRVPKAELRGCGNIDPARGRRGAEPPAHD